MLFVPMYTMCLHIGESHAQSSSNYLETLQDEAEGLVLDKQTESEAQPTGTPPVGNPLTDATKDQAGAIKAFTSGLSVEQFENLLKHNYIGSYLFYKRLGQVQKDEVYEFYQQNPDPDQVRQKILQIKKRL